MGCINSELRLNGDSCSLPPCHTTFSGAVIEEDVEWPARSPDLNLTENPWDRMG